MELNAFISRSKEAGRGEAVAVKDLVDVAGMVTTAGGIILPEIPATEDAPVVARLRRAGCVVVGKANLHEFAYGVTNINPHYGTARNPHDPNRVSGGSSGGSAVAVAAGLCDWAIGSDTGGSIRIPSSLCGVAGFKPAFGSIDIAGVIPLSKSLDTLGPIAPEIDFGDREKLHQVGLTILLFEAAAYHRMWATETPEKYGADVLRLIRLGFDVSEADYRQAMAARAGLAAAATRLVNGVDALILPATAI